MIARSFCHAAAAALAMLVATGIQAQGDDPTPIPMPDPTPADPDPWPSLHQNNRVVAFGAILMASNGSDIDAWQEIRAYTWADAELPSSGGDDASTGTVRGSDDDGSLEYSEVLATTRYDLVVCPDGSAYIARSGEGVALEDRHTGVFFAWAEAILCYPGSIEPSERLNKQRPLDARRIRKTAK